MAPWRPCDVDPGARSRAVVAVRMGATEIVIGRLRAQQCDLELVDALARLHLAAVRLGGAIRLRDVCPQLSGLLDLVGLAVLVAEDDGRPA